MTYNTDIERLNYYEGEYLGATDFEAEQEYQRDMRRRHNVGQHTWGIVSGLDIAQVPPAGQTGTVGQTSVTVYIQPGMAVDGFGREIVVLSQTQLTQDLFAPYYNPNVGANFLTLNVWISYAEALLNPPTDACIAASQPNSFGRVQETFALSITQPPATPTDDSIVVNGAQMSAAVEPKAPTATPPPTPGVIVLPYDNSVPYQEFSTDDSNLNWYILLGQVSWDPHNEVFVMQTDAWAATGREYVGVVAASINAPENQLLIQDRLAPYPLPTATTDPNYNGVGVEVAGSLQVDRLLNAEQQALVGAAYNAATFPNLSPLTIVASGISASGQKNDELIQLCNSSSQETWLICGNLNGSTPGLNFGEITAGGSSPGTSRLFIQSGGGSGHGNVGIGTTAPQQNLSVNAGLNIDQAGKNSGGALTPGLSFGAGASVGSTSGEGIASNQSTGGKNPGGLDFYTNNAPQLSITSKGAVGIGTQAPGVTLDVASGLLHIGGTESPIMSAQGAYLGWNGWNGGGTGETDFINNQGLGTGGFAFMNTPPSGGPPTTLMFITGSGNVGIGTTSPQQNLSLNAGLNIDQANQNPGGTVAPGLTFGYKSGEGIASCRTGGTNTYGLDFYTDFLPRMSINQGGAVTVGREPALPLVPAPGAGSLAIYGNRTYFMGVDGSDNHWLMAGGSTEGTFNAIGFNVNSKQILIGSSTTPWDITVSGTLHAPNKTGCVEDRFINRDGIKLERGDVLVLHSTPSSQYYGSNRQIPLIEVKLATTEGDTRVCGIVDDPALPDSKIPDLDRTKIGDVQVGLMVTLGAYSHCKVDADIASIVPGDLLTTSPTRGRAQKLDPDADAQPGAIIGKALGSLKKGKGTIPILVSHQ